MYRSTQLAGYLALLLTAGALLVGAVVAPDRPSIGAAGLLLGTVLAGAVTGGVERRRHLDRFEAPGFDRADATDALAVVLGAVVTYTLSVSAGLGPVLASALVGSVAGVALARVAAPVYCGSFVGMASPAVFASVEYVALAGLVAGVGFVAATESFGGVGGKLGTLALFGCATTAALAGLDYADVGAPQWELLSLAVPVAVAGAVATVVLSVRLELGAVVGSGLVGVAGGAAFPALAGDLGATMAAVAFCASFVGMSSPERLPGAAAVAAAGGLSGVVFLAVAPAFGGAGGKLGTAAFVSCIALIGAIELRDAAAGRLP